MRTNAYEACRLIAEKINYDPTKILLWYNIKTYSILLDDYNNFMTNDFLDKPAELDPGMFKDDPRDFVLRKLYYTPLPIPTKDYMHTMNSVRISVMDVKFNIQVHNYRSF